VKVPKVAKLKPTELLSASPVWWMREFLDRGCQVIIRKGWPWTIMGNVFGECHASSMLFVDFRK
jgi:hypothetical protein